MISPDSHQPPLPQPTSRGSEFGRKIASKVLLLVEKFESLTRPHPSDQAPQPSYTAVRTSTLRRLGTSVLKRASLFTEERTGLQPEKAQPPKRRFLKVPRTRAKKQASVKDSNKRQSSHFSNGFDCDGSGSTTGSNSTLIDTDISSTSTPPVARILPSSFFDQLLPSNEHTPARGKFNPRKKAWGRKKKMAPRKSIQDLRGNIGQKEFVFSRIRRKPVSSNMSQGNLTGKVLGDLGPVGTFRVLMRGELTSKEGQNAPAQLGLKEANNSFGMLLSDDDEIAKSAKMIHHDEWLYGNSFDIPLTRGTLGSASSSEPAPLICRDRRYLSTDFKYMPDGTLSNFGYFMHRLESAAGTPQPKSENSIVGGNTFTAPLHLVPKTKVYRKTPPPRGFFNPENRRMPSISNMERRLRKDIASEAYSECPQIISPVPLNAVQSAELRGMVFRYT